MEHSRVEVPLVPLQKSKGTNGAPLCGYPHVLLRSFGTRASGHSLVTQCSPSVYPVVTGLLVFSLVFILPSDFGAKKGGGVRGKWVDPYSEASRWCFQCACVCVSECVSVGVRSASSGPFSTVWSEGSPLPQLHHHPLLSSLLFVVHFLWTCCRCFAVVLLLVAVLKHLFIRRWRVVAVGWRWWVVAHHLVGGARLWRVNWVDHV